MSQLLLTSGLRRGKNMLVAKNDRLKPNVTKLFLVGQAILPAAAYQAARSRRLKAGGSQNWLPHNIGLKPVPPLQARDFPWWDRRFRLSFSILA
jgi:hypothetical protein